MAIVLPLVAGYAIGKISVYAYKNLLTPQQKKRIETKVKTHHFEYGLVTTAAGLAIKSPTAVGTGISWIADDWKDKNKALENMKNKVNSTVNRVRKSLQTPNRGYRIVTILILDYEKCIAELIIEFLKKVILCKTHLRISNE